MDGTDTTIRVEGLSKLYRIGVAEERETTLMGSVVRWLRAPAENLRRLRNLTRFRRDEEGDDVVWALRDVSFEVTRGEVLGIIGPNGAGKSTLLKVISRITPPSAGRVTLAGRVASLLEVGTGFHSELTGRENLYLNGSLLGMSKQEIDEKFDEIVDFAGVGRFIDTPVKRYSSGMKVRLGFAVAAHLEPEILLVDEVLAVGDLAFQKKCLDKMQNVAGSGRTILFVSHNLGAVQRLCDRCVFLDHGRLQAEGTPDEVVEEYIRTSAGDASRYEQPPDPDKEILLRRVEIRGADGTPANDVPWHDPFSVVVDYQVNRPLSGTGVWIALYTVDGVCAFATADFDAAPERLGERRPGHYRAAVEIPGRWLNAGRYSLTAAISSTARRTRYDHVEALQFTVVRTDTPDSRNQVIRKGILQPVLSWSTDRVEGTVVPPTAARG